MNSGRKQSQHFFYEFGDLVVLVIVKVKGVVSYEFVRDAYLVLVLVDVVSIVGAVDTTVGIVVVVIMVVVLVINVVVVLIESPLLSLPSSSLLSQ